MAGLLWYCQTHIELNAKLTKANRWYLSSSRWKASPMGLYVRSSVRHKWNQLKIENIKTICSWNVHQCLCLAVEIWDSRQHASITLSRHYTHFFKSGTLLQSYQASSGLPFTMNLLPHWLFLTCLPTLTISILTSVNQEPGFWLLVNLRL